MHETNFFLCKFMPFQVMKDSHLYVTWKFINMFTWSCHWFLLWFTAHFNIIFPPAPGSSTCSRPFRFSDQNFVCISYFFHESHMPLPYHHFVTPTLWETHLVLFVFSETAQFNRLCAGNRICISLKCKIYNMFQYVERLAKCRENNFCS